MAEQKQNKPWFNYHSSLAPALVFLVCVPLLCHLLFSQFGLSLSDDGFTLAYSRRILEGQVPHRDFIIIRPAFSPLLHTPLVLFGGAYTFWLSRFFVWVELASIAWAWLIFAQNCLGTDLKTYETLYFALLFFVSSTHSFPIMAWHTLDGLFCLAIGLALCSQSSPQRKFGGYFILGLAPLCKQSFVFLVPLALFLLGDGRKKLLWLALLLPSSLYFGLLAWLGAFPAAMLQLGTHTNLRYAGFQRYLEQPLTSLGFISGYFLLRLAQKNPKDAFGQRFGQFTLFLLPNLTVIAGLACGYLPIAAFGLFGMVSGALFFLLLEQRQTSKAQLRFALLGLLAAWSASLSVGYNTPVLSTGSLVIPLLLFARGKPFLPPTWNQVYLSGLTLLALGSFGQARVTYLSREPPAAQLTYRLDGVFPGANLIKTNAYKYAFLTDLQAAIALAQRERATFAILPNLPGYWAKAPTQNPLSLDWPQQTELFSPALQQRFLAELKAKRPQLTFIVEKVDSETLATGFQPVPRTDFYQFAWYVRDHFTKVGETAFFELYR